MAEDEGASSATSETVSLSADVDASDLERLRCMAAELERAIDEALALARMIADERVSVKVGLSRR